MIKHGFDMHQVFLSAPGDLEKERDTCRGAISEVNASDAMPAKILLVTVGLTSDGQIVDFRSAVAENVRQSAYYVQIFEDDWGPKNLFRKMFYLAIDCRDDPAFPMQEVAVFLKERSARNRSRNSGVSQRTRTAPGYARVSFRETERLKAQLIELSSEWVGSVLAAGRGGHETRAEGA
jgi:hypothetical protein